MASARKAADARLRYLQDAAQSLSNISPAASTHLGATYQALVNDKTDGPRANPFCEACGKVMIIGWSCTTVVDTKRKRSREDRLAQSVPGVKTFKLKCSICGAVTVLEFAKPSQKRRPTVQTTSTKIDFVSSQVPSPDQHIPEPSIKPAAKRARGKKSSLQSLIASQKASESQKSAGFGFDLQDFMKK